MKMILTINSCEILLPDETGVTNVLKVLSRGLAVSDRTYYGPGDARSHIEILERPLSCEIKMVPAGTRFVREGGVEIVEPCQPRRASKCLQIETTAIVK